MIELLYILFLMECNINDTMSSMYYISIYMLFICPTVGDDLKYLVKVASARFPHYKIIIFPLCNY